MGGVKMSFCLCVVLWDISICFTVIIKRLAHRKSPQTGNIHTKLNYSSLNCFLIPLCSWQHCKTSTHKHPPERVFSTKSARQKKKKKDIYHDSWRHKVQKWHKQYVRSNQEVSVCSSLLFCFPHFTSCFRHLMVVQPHPAWLGANSDLGV